MQRSTYYDTRPVTADDTSIVEVIATIREEFENYGWRRVRVELRHRGMVVNHEKIRRLMRECDLQPRTRRRYVPTNDSDHGQPIFPNLAKDIALSGPDQLWGAEITCVTIIAGFAYVAVILDAWPRLVVGYPISCAIDARPSIAALKTAIERRKPPQGARITRIAACNTPPWAIVSCLPCMG